MTAKTVKSLLGIAIVLTSSLGIAGPKYLNGTVTKHSDGDTIHFVPNDRHYAAKPPEKLKIRMLSMDAPETSLVTPEGPKGQQPWGDMATHYLVSLMPLHSDVTIDDQGKDHFGRTLARVFFSHDDIDLKMVESGWAIPYIICEGERCTPSFFDSENVEGYISACESAVRNERGIFDSDNPLTEMPFEFRVRMQKREFDKYVGDFKTKRLYAPDQYKRVPMCQRIFFMTQTDALAARYRYKAEFEPLTSTLANLF